MDDNYVCKALVEFIGLDEESIKSQVLPYLQSLRTPVESEEYLKSLIGQDPKQSDFIERFCNFNFRKKVEVTRNLRNESAFPSLPSASKNSQSYINNSSINTNFSNKNNRVKVKQTQNLAKKDSDVQNKQTIDPIVYKNFRNPDNVYIKPRDSTNSSSSNKKKNLNSNKYESVTPEPKPEPTKNIQLTPQEITLKTEPKSDLPPDIDIPISEISPSILKEILEVKLILESFESPDTIPNGAAQCFCEARTHSQPSSRLPKQCVNCGLIFCRMKPALSPCPSCHESSRLSKNLDLKENIRSELIMKRNSLIQTEIAKYKNRLSLEQQKEALAREAERDYPTLPTKPSTSKNKPTRNATSSASTYSNQIDSSNSIQNRIKLGYKRLAKEFEAPDNSQSTTTRGSKTKSHTVVRLHPNGKTKIITTTQIKSKDKQQQREEEIKFDQIFNPDFLENSCISGSVDPPFIDQFDDLFRNLSHHLDLHEGPILFVDKKYIPVVPSYVTNDVYQV